MKNRTKTTPARRGKPRGKIVKYFVSRDRRSVMARADNHNWHVKTFDDPVLKRAEAEAERMVRALEKMRKNNRDNRENIIDL